MKKFLINTSFVLLPVVAVFVVLEIFYRVVPNNYVVKWENIEKPAKKIEILIFGNSHTFYGLNPDFFKKNTFNLANVSQTIYFDKLLFDRYVDSVKPSVIVLSVEYTSLSQIDNSGEDKWRKYYYEDYMHLDVPLVSQWELRTHFLSLTRSFATNVDLLRLYIKKGTIVNTTKSGFGFDYLQQNRMAHLDELAMITVKRHEDGSTDFTNTIDSLEQIIKVCKTKGIKVVLLTMPVSKKYAATVNATKLSKIFASCETLERQYTDVFYLNMFNDVRFTDEDFYDADHLHNKGAEKCSEIVNAFIQNH